MLAFAVAGICVVVTAFSMMARFHLLRWLAYNNVLDIAFTIAMIVMLHGTFSGIIAASFAGAVMSLALYFARYSFGYERLERSGWKWIWVRYPGQANKQARWIWTWTKAQIA